MGASQYLIISYIRDVGVNVLCYWLRDLGIIPTGAKVAFWMVLSMRAPS